MIYNDNTILSNFFSTTHTLGSSGLMNDKQKNTKFIFGLYNVINACF